MKKTKFELLLMKIFSRKKYNDEKDAMRLLNFSEEAKNYNEQGVFQFSRKRNSASFKHSGHTGDIVYSLPTVRALADSSDIYLSTNIKASLPSSFKHPYGDSQLPEKAVELLRPLLLSQNYINSVDMYVENQTLDFDLDLFRKTPQMLVAGSISQWYFSVFGVSPDISQPWIFLENDASAKDYIIISRSSRYLNESLDYGFLKKYPKLGFVGLPSEYQEMKKSLPSMQYFEVSNFLELALVIRSSLLFIGNQSFPYSIAEAMKVPRLLEQCLYAPNVVAVGGFAHPIVFQKQFEFVLDDFMR